MSEMTRREALNKIYQAAVGVGASGFISLDDVLAAGNNKINQPTVIWLHGTACSGCSCSFLNIEDVPVFELITEFMDLVYHPDLSLATGKEALNIINQLIQSNRKYIFVFEGAIPVRLPHTCLLGGMPIMEWVTQLASRAAVCIAVGTCASFGGVAKMKGTITGNMNLGEYLDYKHIEVPLVNLPNCPLKPEHITYSLLYYIKHRKQPELDHLNRPLHFYRKTIHERCTYYRDFQEDNFAEFIGDDGCLFKLGCQGPVTYNDCPKIGHNKNTNICIRAGHPCIGCADSEFPRKIMFHSFDDKRSLVRS